MKRGNLIAYAMAFSSYLIQSLKREASVQNIVLFGSVARGDFDSKSDIDIFVDTKEDIEKEVSDILDSFYNSIIYKNYWKLLGINNDLSVKVGDISRWELRRSIISHGISLFSKYREDIGGKLFSMFIIDVGGKRNQKLKIWRKIYGYRQRVKGKEYSAKGLLDELDAKRIGPAVFILPIENTNAARQFLNKNKVKHRIIEMQTDSAVLV